MTCPRLSGRSLFHFSLTVLLVASTVSGAQQPATTAAPSAPAKAPDFTREAVVVEKQITRIREEAYGTGTREQSTRVRVQADAGVKQLAVLGFTYTAGNQQVDIAYVRVIKPDGTVVVTPDYNVQDLPADVTREAPMYSDLHQKHVAVKGLGVGDTLEYKITLRTTKPEVPGHFWMEYSFQKELIVQDEELDLDVPADKQVKVASADVQPTVTTAGGRKIYHWVSSNLSRPDPDAPPKSHKHQKPSVQVSTFSSWEQVGAWYASLATGQAVVTPAIRARADALTKGLTSSDDKIRALFESVALHTHYVGLEFGIGRYQPHPADDVLSNEYGDCKDKHTLLAALLKAEGIEAWPALIPSVRELDPDMPSPAQFDHVITVVPRDGKLVWMDSTAEITPVGILFANLRDKQALVVPNDKPARLERTAETLPYQQSAKFEATGKLSDTGVFTARISQTYQGDAGYLMRAAFRQVPQAQWKEFLQRVSGTFGFGGEIKEPEVSAVENTGEPLHFAYDYTREKFSEWDDHRISPAMPPIGVELMPGIKETKPADDVELGSPGETVYNSKIEVPANFELYPPQDVHLKEDWVEYDATYTFKDHVYAAQRRLLVKKTKIPLADWDKYLDFRRAVYADSVKMAPLMTKQDRAIGEATFYSAGTYNFNELRTKIQPLVEAGSKLSASTPPAGADLAALTESCRKTVADFESHSLELNSVDQGVFYWAQMLAAGWTTLGWAEMQANDLPAAENHLRAAWNLSQAQLPGFLLGQLLEKRGDKKEAARLYEFASVTGSQGMIDSLNGELDVPRLIGVAYQKLTGGPIKARALGANGVYQGSLLDQLSRTHEIRGYIPTTKLTGDALYAMTYEADKPVKAQFLSGDPKMATLASSLEKSRFQVLLPTGSKARITRQAKLVCSPYGGCDAYLLLPSRIETLSRKVLAMPVEPGTTRPKIVRSSRPVDVLPEPK